MSSSTWTPRAVASNSARWQGTPWRLVEAQHVASTMKIVDSSEEQDILEMLLEDSKPAVPAPAKDLHYLLATPFRYSPFRPGSRFRGLTDPGVFYGAESVQTASAELGYWRWRFLQDAAELGELEPVAHTAFQSRVDAIAVDLRQPPFDKDKKAWSSPTDYGPTQAFARVARSAEIEAIIYQSVRDPAPAWCVAVLLPSAFVSRQPHRTTQTWWLAVNREGVNWRRDDQSIIFSADVWR